MDLPDVTAIITWHTVPAVLAAGLALAAFLWRTSRHIRGIDIVRGWTIGAAFLAVMGSSRFAQGSQHWEAWVGTGLLWTGYVCVAYASVRLWRWQKRKREAR